MIEATKPYIPIRIDQVKDQALWKKYDVDGVGVFLVCDPTGAYKAAVNMDDARTESLVASFLKTLPEQWKTFEPSITRPAFAATVEVALAAGKKDGKPVAVVFAKADDAASTALLALLEERPVQKRLDRLAWAKVTWGEEKPAEAGTYGVSKAPGLVLVDPDDGKVLDKPKLGAPDALATALEKACAKLDALRKARAAKGDPKRAPPPMNPTDKK